MSFPDWRQIKEKTAMAEKVGRIKEFAFMKETAMVHIEEREIIAWCYIYELINPEDKEFIDYLKKTVIPALTKLGRSRWYRDTLTDLAFALSARKRKGKTHDVKDVLDAKIGE